MATSFVDALDNLSDVVDAFTALLDLPGVDATAAAVLRSAITTFDKNRGAMIQDPSLLADSLTDLFTKAYDLYDGLSTAAWERLFTFGDQDPNPAPTTASLIERTKNRDVMRASVKSLALAYAYADAVQGDYQTTTELEDQQSALGAQYRTTIVEPGLTNEAQELVDQIRVQAQASFDIARVNARSVITIETPRMPLSVLLYRYYGNTDDLELISDINGINENASVEGEVQILTV